MSRLFFSFLFFCFAFLTSAQKSTYIEYGLEDGLPQSQVRAISQDSAGFLWLGTMAGLSRFDGSEFYNFSKEDGLTDNQINCFYQGTKLYVGTTGSICHVEGKKISSLPFPENLKSARVLDFAESTTGKLYMATAGDGVIVWDGSDFSVISPADGLPDDYVRSLAFDSAGKLWIGTRSGIVVADEDGAIAPPPAEELSDLSVSQMRTASNGEIVISTFGNGVFFLGKEGLRNHTEKSGMATDFVRCFQELIPNQFWFGSKLGLTKIEEGRATNYDESNGLAYANIKSLGRDAEGNLWIGTDGQGLLRRAGDIFKCHTTQDGLLSDLVMCIEPGIRDSLMLGTYDEGISIFSGDSAVAYAFNKRLPSSTVWSLKKTSTGLMAGTSSGLFIEENGVTSVLDEENGLPGHRITAISGPSLGGFLIGTENGLAKLRADGNIGSTIAEIEGKNLGAVRSIVEIDDLIFCGTDLGLVKLADGDAKLIPGPIPEEASVYCIKPDNSGSIWVGTSDGLFELASGLDQLVPVPFATGFGAKNINFLATLEDKRLMVGTNDGVYLIDLEAYHKAGSVKARHFTKFEGLSGSETNQNSAHIRDGMVWFGTTQGMIRFDPSAASERKTFPEVSISNLQLFLEDADWEKTAENYSAELDLPIDPELKYSQNYLTFNYSGIYLTNPEKVRYRYKVEGVDDNWLGPTKSRAATYAYLPHGDFTFRLEAFQIDNPDLVGETAFSFSIKPPFYLTNWFFALVALSIAALVYAIYSSRLRKEKEKREKLQLELQAKLMQLESQTLNSSMNRHFIFNALNSIQYYINMQDRKSANRYLTSFAKLIRKNLDSSQKMDTSLGEELERLKLYLALEQMRFQEKFDYTIDIDPDIDIDALTLPAMMLQPFLENSIWHGILPSDRHGKILIRIDSDDEYYEIAIDDNGVGIDTSLRNKSNGHDAHVSKGMDITLSRVRLYHNMTGLSYDVDGPFERKSKSGEVLGTRVLIRIPKKSTVPELQGSKTWKIEAGDVL